MVIKKIGILGLGAIGGLMATHFYDYSKECIYVIADEKRVERAQREGMIVNGKMYDFQYISPSSPKEMDLIIVAVKYHHLQEAITLMKDFIHKDTVVMSLMNGINTEAEIGSVYGIERMLYSFIVEVSAVKQGSVIQASNGKIVFNSNPANNKNVQLVKEIFRKSGIVFEITEDIIREIWWKFMINVGVNQTSAVLDAPYGLCQQNTYIRKIMDAAMKEVILISQYEGIHLSNKDLQRWYPVLEGLNPQGMTSMLQDMRANRKTEVEMFSGVVCQLGEKHGISTPVNQMLYQLIKAKETMNITGAS
ncbi:MAG: ketopantoate reductase family protein [Eubacteriales bacterium]